MGILFHTYGTDAMIQIEVDGPSPIRRYFEEKQNVENIVVDLDIIEEVREKAYIHEEACKRIVVGISWSIIFNFLNTP